MPIVTLKAPGSVTSVSLGGVEHFVQDGILEVESLPAHLHQYLIKALNFVEISKDEVQALFDTKIEKADKAVLISHMNAAGFKVDGRMSFNFIQKRYDQLVAEGKIKSDVIAPVAEAAPVVEPAPVAETPPSQPPPDPTPVAGG
jgi:hypothetical protein